MTIFSICIQSPVDRNMIWDLHTFLVMNLNGKIKIFQCFKSKYSIDQWMKGVSDKSISRQTSHVLSQYGGKKYATQKSIDKFITTLADILSDNEHVDINKEGRSIFGGDLYDQSIITTTIYPSIRYIQHEIEVDAEYNPRTTLTCGERCLDVMDSILSAIPYARRQASKKKG